MGPGYDRGFTRAEWSSTGPEGRINKVMAQVTDDDPRASAPLFYKYMTLVSASKISKTTATATFDIVNDAYWSNEAGNMHGGAQATIYDICTSLALVPIAETGFWMHGGVSRTLNVSYLRPAVTGQDVRVECRVVNAGRRLAFLTASMTRKTDRVLLSTCEHHKVSVEPRAKL